MNAILGARPRHLTHCKCPGVRPCALVHVSASTPHCAGPGLQILTICPSGRPSARRTGGLSHRRRQSWCRQGVRRFQRGLRRASPTSSRPPCTRCTLVQTSRRCHLSTCRQRLRPSTALTPWPQTCCSSCLARHCWGASAAHSSLPCQQHRHRTGLPVRRSHRLVRNRVCRLPAVP